VVKQWSHAMHSIIYIVGLIVIVVAILSFLGLG
jgi:ABC-type dipeptide/oligopeptide/nickel transport system permease subunit